MSDDDNVQWKLHESLNFTDGNIVLSASRPDKPGSLFRVHKSVLSSHSPIFKDMFDLCGPSNGSSETGLEADNFFDQVPIVHMSDDADHLESILKILYYQSSLSWTPRSPHYPVLITPVLNLSKKYGIDSIHRQVQGHLESDWPQTLEDWDRLENDIEFMTTNISTFQRMVDFLPEPAAAIQLARQFDIHNILPAAFYHLSRISILDDWDTTHPNASTIRNPIKCTARWGLLSAADFRCLLLGKAEMDGMLRRCINWGAIFHTESSRPSSSACRVGENVWKDICDRCSQSADPLALLRSSVGAGGQMLQDKRCDTCMTRLKAQVPKVRKMIWEKLDELFHLEECL